jgi:hypothetical protein
MVRTIVAFRESPDPEHAFELVVNPDREQETQLKLDNDDVTEALVSLVDSVKGIDAED